MNQKSKWAIAIALALAVGAGLGSSVNLHGNIINADTGYQLNASGGTSGQALCSDGTYFDTPCWLAPGSATLLDEYNAFSGCNFPNDGANLTCTNTVTLGTAMADTSYVVSCTEYTNPAVGSVILGNISYAVSSTTQYTVEEMTQGSSGIWGSYANYGKSYVCHAHHS